jgi:threonine dehydrogenase-like Zn-dependent dehydrogenase
MLAFTKELSIWVPRDAEPDDIRVALDLMVRGKIDMSSIISAVHSPERASETYEHLGKRDSDLITAAFDWRSE